MAVIIMVWSKFLWAFPETCTADDSQTRAMAVETKRHSGTMQMTLLLSLFHKCRSSPPPPVSPLPPLAMTSHMHDLFVMLYHIISNNLYTLLICTHPISERKGNLCTVIKLSCKNEIIVLIFAQH